MRIKRACVLVSVWRNTRRRTVDNPNTVSNPEIDKVVQSVVSEFRDNHGSDAVNQINTEYNNHRTDPTFTKQFTQELTQELEKQHLLPQVSEQLFGSADAMKPIDLDQDGSFSRSEAMRIRGSKALSGTLTPFQQEVVAYLMINASQIDKSGAADPTITPENLKDYADHAQDRLMELKIAGQIFKDPQKFHDQFTSDPTGWITKSDLQNQIDSTADKLKMLNGEDDPTTAKTKANLQETKDIAEYLLQHRSEVAKGNWASNDFSKQQLINWAQNANLMDTEHLPTIVLTIPEAAKQGSIDGGKSGYTSDLIAEYAKTHMADMALAGSTYDAQYGGSRFITKSDIDHYRQMRKDTLTPFENNLLDEMSKRYDQILGAAGEYNYGITADDLNAYAKQQAEQRTTSQGELPKDAPSDQDLAIKAGSYFSDPANFNQFSKKNNGKVTVNDLQQQINETDQLIGGGGLSAKTLEHLKERSQMAHFVQQQMKDHDNSSATQDQVYQWINELGGNYLDANGNHSSPELVAAAAAAPKPDTSSKGGGGEQPNPHPADLPNPTPTANPVDQPNPTPNPQPGDQQPAGQNQPKDDHRKSADQAPQLDKYHQYIKDHITDKGGFTPEIYANALAQAQSSGKEIVLVVGSKDHPEMMRAAAKGIEKNNAVYVYVDKDSIDPSSALGKYVSQVMPGDRTGAIGYNVTLSEGGHLQPGPAHLEVLNTKTPAAQPGDTPQPQPSPQPSDQPQSNPNPTPQPGDQPPLNPQQGELPPLNPNPQDQSSAWSQYIMDNITAKGGYTADRYIDALKEASTTGKEVIIVFGNPNNPAMVEGAANGILRQGAVYVYADTNTLNPNSGLGKLARLSLQGRQSGAIGFKVESEDDGTYRRERYHPVNFTGAHHEQVIEYSTQPERHMSAQATPHY
jgi:hypothetical protein